MRWRDILLEDFGNDVVLALEEVELAGERGLDGGEVRINVGPGKSEGGGRRGVAWRSSKALRSSSFFSSMSVSPNAIVFSVAIKEQRNQNKT